MLSFIGYPTTRSCRRNGGGLPYISLFPRPQTDRTGHSKLPVSPSPHLCRRKNIRTKEKTKEKQRQVGLSNTAVREPMAKGVYTRTALFPERDGRRKGQGRGPGKGHNMVYGLFLGCGFFTAYSSSGSLWFTVSLPFAVSHGYGFFMVHGFCTV